MKLAFCIFKYFPFGGVQRDFLRLALLCAEQGYLVQVFTLSWQGEIPQNINVEIIPKQGFSNHTRYQNYIDQVTARLQQEKFNAVIGFNKMPGLDLYYAADPCYVAKITQRYGKWYTWFPRYRLLAACEQAVFNNTAKTKILLLTEKQLPDFQKYYCTQTERFAVLPPGVELNRRYPDDAVARRRDIRQHWHLAADDKVLLAVGSGFKTKGLDRTLFALEALPAAIKNKTRLLVLGQDSPFFFKRLVKQLRLLDRVHFLGGREDLMSFLLAADILVHPAYAENTGTVLLEAVIAGLPVLTTDVCGYAHYVTAANAGIVLPSPFSQAHMEASLTQLLSRSTADLSAAGIAYGKTANWYEGPAHALASIEQCLRGTA